MPRKDGKSRNARSSNTCPPKGSNRRLHNHTITGTAQHPCRSAAQSSDCISYRLPLDTWRPSALSVPAETLTWATWPWYKSYANATAAKVPASYEIWCSLPNPQFRGAAVTKGQHHKQTFTIKPRQHARGARQKRKSKEISPSRKSEHSMHS